MSEASNTPSVVSERDVELEKALELIEAGREIAGDEATESAKELLREGSEPEEEYDTGTERQ